MVRRPGRGGLSALGAEQLRKYFSTETSQDEKLSIGAMDPTASMTVMQMAAEEIDAAGMTYGELRKAAEETIVACEGREREAAFKGGNREIEEVAQGGQDMETEGDVEVVDEEMGEEDWEEGGVALAKDY